MEDHSNSNSRLRTGWASALAKFAMAGLLFEGVSGLAITFLPFHPAIQWTVLAHTLAGVLVLGPLAWYCASHWLDYRRYASSHIVLLGFVGLVALLLCVLSGMVLTWQGLLGVRTSAVWRKLHLFSTFAALGTILPHVLFAFLRAWRDQKTGGVAGYAAQTLGATIVGGSLIGALALLYSGSRYANEFPQDYNYLYGTNRPFAPSLARTDTGTAFDARSLAGSTSCGTAGCHDQIWREWLPSAHRYAAMDPAFQGIQEVMAKQNGAESTRYCGGCHDPISLFSGTKNLFVENLTGLHGYQEGVSCLACHAIRETDVKGNANYTITQPREYLWQWQTNGLGKLARDFLIRTYPDEHNKLSKRAFKKPEYCAACHKQFIDQEVNRVGWVQLQNQYDNWAASHWNQKGNAQKTIECRECHMPLVDSLDPAAGDAADYNRTASDGKHRSHRFLGANQMISRILPLESGEQHARLVEQWLQGTLEVPEIRGKWAEGPIVKVALQAPESVAPGEAIPLRVVLASNKVGHDFPTGPLDIIQSWLEVRVTDDNGREIYSSGKRDAKNFIEPGSFLFKAEPVDQHGNLIDRHNLWEMVGVRYRRALFPGYSDTVQYSIPCPSTIAQQEKPAASGDRRENLEIPAPSAPGPYHIAVILQYRKIDQFLLNYLFGENKLTAPVTEITRATLTVLVKNNAQAAVPKETAVAQAAKP
ncbi:MAG: cytochrome b/b6 domain-containing protein [Verrucomicrobia bacterium]|nr:cytochrome b/b6 domain-containing protein [Verrucomicrobiota bacterium]